MSRQVQIAGMAWYMREDYAALLGVMVDGHVLPRSYDDWLKKAEEAERQFKARGIRIVRVVIDPKAFPIWCQARGLDIDAKARMAFANDEAARQAGAIG